MDECPVDCGDGLLDDTGAAILPSALQRPTGAATDATGEGLLEHCLEVGADRAFHTDRALQAQAEVLVMETPCSRAPTLHAGELDLARLVWPPTTMWSIGAAAVMTPEDADILVLLAIDRVGIELGKPFIGIAMLCSAPWCCDTLSSACDVSEDARADGCGYCITRGVEMER